MVAVTVKVQRKRTHDDKYESVIITIPRAILREVPALKKAKRVRMDTDGQGRVWFEPVKG